MKKIFYIISLISLGLTISCTEKTEDKNVLDEKDKNRKTILIAPNLDTLHKVVYDKRGKIIYNEGGYYFLHYDKQIEKDSLGVLVRSIPIEGLERNIMFFISDSLNNKEMRSIFYTNDTIDEFKIPLKGYELDKYILSCILYKNIEMDTIVYHHCIDGIKLSKIVNVLE